jgi:hypothetical protein
MNTDLLLEVANRIKSGYEFMGSKWQNCEAEVIALQTLTASAVNFKSHGDAFSWLGSGATRGQDMSGTNNADGLARLFADGSLIEEVYVGPLTPPVGTAQSPDGRPLVLRVTTNLLKYADSFIQG